MNKIVQVSFVAISIAVGSYIGYVAVSSLLNEGIPNRFGRIYRRSKDKMNVMSEEVAVKTAKLTNNPGITQEWVAKQWESIEY